MNEFLRILGIGFCVTCLASVGYVALAVLVARGAEKADANLVDIDEPIPYLLPTYDDYLAAGANVEAIQAQIDYANEAIEEATFASILAASYPEGLPEFGGAA